MLKTVELLHFNVESVVSWFFFFLLEIFFNNVKVFTVTFNRFNMEARFCHWLKNWKIIVTVYLVILNFTELLDINSQFWLFILQLRVSKNCEIKIRNSDFLQLRVCLTVLTFQNYVIYKLSIMRKKKSELSRNNLFFIIYSVVETASINTFI